MNKLLKIVVATAFAAVIVEVARRARWFGWSPEDLPTLEPVRDAEGQVREPLREEDLRVAQNAPL